MAYLISFIVLIVSIGIGVSASGGGPGNLVLLLDVPSLIMILVPAFAFSIAATSGKTTWVSFKTVFSGTPKVPREEAQEVQACLNVFGNVSLLMGIIGMLIGLVLMLSDLSDPNAIGPNMAVACIMTLYGSLLKFICFGVERGVRQSTQTSEQGG